MGAAAATLAWIVRRSHRRGEPEPPPPSLPHHGIILPAHGLPAGAGASPIPYPSSTSPTGLMSGSQGTSLRCGGAALEGQQWPHVLVTSLFLLLSYGIAMAVSDLGPVLLLFLYQDHHMLPWSSCDWPSLRTRITTCYPD